MWIQDNSYDDDEEKKGGGREEGGGGEKHHLYHLMIHILWPVPITVEAL